MPALYIDQVARFLASSPSEIVGLLSLGYARQGFIDQKADQTEAWMSDIASLQSCLDVAIQGSPRIADWSVLLEFVIPRKGKRIDVVLLSNDEVVIVELEIGGVSGIALQQVEEYALLLHYFHKPSSQRRIIPFAVSSTAVSTPLNRLRQMELDFTELPSRWIVPATVCNWSSFADALKVIAHQQSADRAFEPALWNTGAYFPVPTIIDAALALRTGLGIREIAHSEASELEIGEVTSQIQRTVSAARDNGEFVICFLTGVPGSGKTLVGLGLAHSKENQGPPIHFMSGNGPLVKVLQHLFTQQAMRDGVPAPQARIQARTLIENVHLFAKQYAQDARTEVPSNHVIIFDEAQRAWNRTQNYRKFKRDYSEPEMLLSIMERHDKWAAVIALVGGGQEINDGEAGLEEWGRSLQNAKKDWKIYASPEVVHGGDSTAGHRLFEVSKEKTKFHAVTHLHLRTSNRSIRAESLAKWVNALINGDARTASSLRIGEKFPLLLTRNLNKLKSTLRKEAIGHSRFGLVASSGAARLRAEGLEPDSTFHAEYPWEHWYLASKGDVRSSYQCEVFATEFEIQGLELDWVGLCWGGDFVWKPQSGWIIRKFRPGVSSQWAMIKNPDRRRFRENAYRVLLTRARQGLVIFVPPGDADDPTRSPNELDATADFLLKCGVKDIDNSKADYEGESESDPSLCSG